MNISLISLSVIAPDPAQPRRHHDEESLQGLADSIKQHGLLQPITVTRQENVEEYLIVTGERRWRAASLAKLDAIPCIVREFAEEDRLTTQLIENLQREDLQPLEKAKGILLVKSALNLTNREMARRLGLSERSVGYLLDLLTLPEELGEAVVSAPNRPSDGKITEKHARFLKQLNDEPELQSAVAGKIHDEKLTGEQTGRLVRAIKQRPERAEELLSEGSDFLADFFGEEPEEITLDRSSERAVCEPAKKVYGLLPALAGIGIDRLAENDLGEVEEALETLREAVENLLSACRAGKN